MVLRIKKKNNELIRSNGEWLNHNYLEKIPIGGGRFRYIYENTKNSAKNVASNLRDKITDPMRRKKAVELANRKAELAEKSRKGYEDRENIIAQRREEVQKKVDSGEYFDKDHPNRDMNPYNRELRKNAIRKKSADRKAHRASKAVVTMQKKRGVL